MGLKPVLFIKAEDGMVKVRARLRDDIAEHDIVLNSVLTYYWTNNLNPIEKFLELFESVIKRTINELMPHKDLYLEYVFKVDNNIEEASSLDIELVNVVADDVGFKIEGKELSLTGFRNVDRNPDEEVSYVSETVEKHIETPEIVLKKYRERK